MFDTEDARLQTLSISTSFTVILDVDDLAASRIADSIHRGRHHGMLPYRGELLLCLEGRGMGNRRVTRIIEGKKILWTALGVWVDRRKLTMTLYRTITRQSRHSQAEKKTIIMPHDETFLPLDVINREFGTSIPSLFAPLSLSLVCLGSSHTSPSSLLAPCFIHSLSIVLINMNSICRCKDCGLRGTSSLASDGIDLDYVFIAYDHPLLYTQGTRTSGPVSL